MASSDSKLGSVTDLAAIAADPTKAESLPLDAVEALLGKNAIAQGVLVSRLLALRAKAHGPSVVHSRTVEGGQHDLIDSRELATRWSVPESWVRDGVRNRSEDRIPCVRFGRYIRFEWGSPELAE